MKLSISRFTVLALTAAPIATAFTSGSPAFSSVRYDSAMAMAKKQQQQQPKVEDTEAFFLEDPMNADAFADSMEEQLENLDEYETANTEFGSELQSLDYANDADAMTKSMPSMKNVKMPDISSKIQSFKDSVDEEQVKELLGKAGAFSKSAFAFSKTALVESVELAKQAKASMSTTQVGKDKDTTYEDAWNKVGKAGLGVWSLVKDFGGFVQENVDVEGLKASAESTLSNIKAKKNAVPVVEFEEEEYTAPFMEDEE